MKKFLLLIVTLIATLFAFGQQIDHTKVDQVTSNPKSIDVTLQTEVEPTVNANQAMQTKTLTKNQRAYNPPGIVIGSTTYDLQTNNGSTRRIHVNPANNQVSAVWTGSTDPTTTWADRGTFYNSTTGGTWGAAPTARLESSRHGWPVLAITDNVEFWGSHLSDPTLPSQAYVDWGTGTPGSGSFTAGTPANFFGLWPRAAAGGSNGTTIHLMNTQRATEGDIGATNDRYKYYRSIDDGATWGITYMEFMGVDSLSGHNTLGGDAYPISACKDVVAAAIGTGGFSPLYIAKSIDNGTTWTTDSVPFGTVHALNHGGNVVSPEVVVDGTYDFSDTIPSYNKQDVLVDHNGTVHVVAAKRRYFDDDATDATISIFGTTELLYWNDNMGDDFTKLTGTYDYDLNAALDVNGTFAYGDANKTMPNLSIDTTTGNLYLIYSCWVENTHIMNPTGGTTNDIDQNFMDIYGTVSTDTGKTWSSAVNFTKGSFYGIENVFPSTTPIVANGKIHLMWMRDNEPGIALQNDMDPVQNNEIVYMELDVATDFVESTPVVDFAVSDDHLTQTAGFAVMTLEDASTGAEVWQWDIQDQAGFVYASFIEPFQGPLMSHLVPCDDTYDVTLTIFNTSNLLGMGETITKSHTIPNCSIVGIEESKLLKDILIYPNPSEGLVKLDVNNTNIDLINVTVLNVLGEQVIDTKGYELTGSPIVLDLSDQSSGMYMVEIEVEGNKVIKRVTLTK